MSLKTMRILIVNVSVILVLLAMVQDTIQLSTDIFPDPCIKQNCGKKAQECIIDRTNTTEHAAISTFFGKKIHRTNLSALIKMYFEHSLNYLFTGRISDTNTYIFKCMLQSQQYASQFVQRPGMAKILKEASDKKWEEGLDILKKSFQRGARTEYIFQPTFRVSGKGSLDNCIQSGPDYVETLGTLVEESHTLLKSIERVYWNALNKNAKNKHGDGEIAHYFEDHMEAEAKIIREMAGHYFTLKNMEDLGVAISIFDSNI